MLYDRTIALKATPRLQNEQDKHYTSEITSPFYGVKGRRTRCKGGRFKSTEMRELS